MMTERLYTGNVASLLLCNSGPAVSKSQDSRVAKLKIKTCVRASVGLALVEVGCCVSAPMLPLNVASRSVRGQTKDS